MHVLSGQNSQNSGLPCTQSLRIRLTVAERGHQSTSSGQALSLAYEETPGVSAFGCRSTTLLELFAEEAVHIEVFSNPWLDHFRCALGCCRQHEEYPLAISSKELFQPGMNFLIAPLGNHA
jgi:hypothetical protein